MFCSCNHIIGRAVTVGGAMMYGAGGIDTAFTAKLFYHVCLHIFCVDTSDDKSQ